MSARSCSSARPDFFERQAEPGQRLVHQAEAGLDLVSRQQPGSQLLQGDVRPTRHLGRDRVVMRCQLECLPVALRSRLGLAGGAAPAQRLVDVGDTDLEQLRHHLSRAAAVHGSQRPRPQIRRIALPRLPRHRTTSVRCNRAV